MKRAAIIAAFALLIPTFAVAQGNATDAIERLLDDIQNAADDGYTLVPEAGNWGGVFGWFSDDEEKSMPFEVVAGRTYRVVGRGDEFANDLDICIYDTRDREVDCDELSDNFPVVTFTARESGQYRAELKAYDVARGETSYAGMAIMRRR